MEYTAFKSFFTELNLISNKERRAPLVMNMKKLVDNNQGCHSCEGYCCTYENNSMQVDLIQTIDLFFYLTKKYLWNQELKSSLEKNARGYRLNNEVTDGQGRTLRRYYTCPFYINFACEISPKSKPYGCLAFNALEKNVAGPGKCSSNLTLLNQRHSEHEKIETVVNEKLKNYLSIFWDKKPITTALLDLMNIFPPSD